MCPAASKIVPSVIPARLCGHCLLIETANDLVLVDTGLGRADLENPKRRLGISRFGLGADYRPERCAIHQIERLGLDPADVRHIILTHMDLDHAGGISDFPEAEVHVMRGELAEARAPSVKSKLRYRKAQWETHSMWREHDETAGEDWFGFQAVRDIAGLPPELLIVPIAGHSAGHLGVAVDGPNGWMFHVGDAFYHPGQLTGGGPAGLRWLARSVDHDYAAAQTNRARLLALMRSNPELDVFCAHDPAALDRLAAS